MKPRVYPRVCGGTLSVMAVLTIPGSIPACAGEPRGESLD